MKIVFITLLNIKSLNDDGIYSDLLREFIKNGHEVHTYCAVDQNKKIKCIETYENDSSLWHVNVGQIQKTNIIKKGLNTLLLDKKMKRAIVKNEKNNLIDLIIYTTPPITLIKTISCLKKRFNAKTYLLLKDIFPQNSIDLGMLTKNGFKGLIYKYFRNIEKKLYRISDYIGCMSQANLGYVIKHNGYLNSKNIEINPNSIDITRLGKTKTNKVNEIREEYGLPINKKIFVYGGNLGKPQSVGFIISCIDALKNDKSIHFLIIGNGTDFKKIQSCSKSECSNLTVMKYMPNSEYETLLSACDVALLFLDYRFTIPNYPSRLLEYLKIGLPIVASTDSNTDIKDLILDNGIGCWCPSNSTEAFKTSVYDSLKFDKKTVKEKELNILKEQFATSKAYNIIMKHFE